MSISDREFGRLMDASSLSEKVAAYEWVRPVRLTLFAIKTLLIS